MVRVKAVLADPEILDNVSEVQVSATSATIRALVSATVNAQLRRMF